MSSYIIHIPTLNMQDFSTLGPENRFDPRMHPRV